MKSVLIIVPGFGHGGTNRSLLNLLAETDHSEVKIQILAMEQCGSYKEKFMQFQPVRFTAEAEAVCNFRKKEPA